MVILGLGSNVGDRLLNLRKALSAIQQLDNLKVVQVSPIYLSDALLPESAPPDWDMPFLNLAVRCETTLDVFDLLQKLKNIEWSIGRKPEIRHWGPRVIDIDIFIFNDLIIDNEQLTIPHVKLRERPFGLWPLADVAPFWVDPNQEKNAAALVEEWGSRFTGQAPFHTRQINHRIDTPQIVGTMNITPDSFSDGGKFLDVGPALKQAFALVEQGAEILDLGAESTCPQSKAIDPETEWQRLSPVLSAVLQAKAANQFFIPPKISVDTRNIEVAKRAVDLGIDCLNDVTGFQDPKMRALASEAEVDCIMMHHVSIPASSKDFVIPINGDPISFLMSWGENQIKRLEQSGIKREKIIFDPGVCFGKTAVQSLEIIKQAKKFKDLGVRVLIGHSRKTFLSLFTALPFKERDIETITMSLFLANQEIDYLRIHNVDQHLRALKIAKALATV